MYVLGYLREKTNSVKLNLKTMNVCFVGIDYFGDYLLVMIIELGELVDRLVLVVVYFRFIE